MTDQKDAASKEPENYGLEQAKAQYSSICEMVAALEVDYDRLEELRDERKDLEDTILDDDAELNQAEKLNGHERAHAELALREWDEENAEEFNELSEAAGDCENQDAARDRIQEDPLSVEVRSGWYSPGWSDSKGNQPPEEFQILLATGGPAVRIMGELDERGQPVRAWMEYSDWYKPWTQFFGASQDTLLAYAREFYFGEG